MPFGIKGKKDIEERKTGQKSVGGGSPGGSPKHDPFNNDPHIMTFLPIGMKMNDKMK